MHHHKKARGNEWEGPSSTVADTKPVSYFLGEKKTPLISVITVCKNSDKHLETCIESVLCQVYDNYEFIIIDGASIDGTLDIIRKYESRITHWISEPDKGISEAFNKGLLLASGLYINFLGSDDYFENDHVLADIAQRLTKMYPCIGYGKVNVRGPATDEQLLIQGEPFVSEKFRERNRIPHQGSFVRRDYFDKYGSFDPSLRIGMDYEHLLRGIFDVSVEFLDVTVANFTTGGASDSYRRITERVSIHRRHGLHGPIKLYTLFFLSSLRWLGNYLLMRTPSLHKTALGLLRNVAMRRRKGQTGN